MELHRAWRRILITAKVRYRAPESELLQRAEPLGLDAQGHVELAAEDRAGHRLGMLTPYGLHTEANRCTGHNPGATAVFRGRFR
jgi:hypothetical protein